jgi:hypothetical protein
MQPSEQISFTGCLTKQVLYEENEIIVIYLTSSCVILAFFGMSGPV